MIKEKYEDAATYADEAISSVRDHLQRGTDQVTQIVDDQPGKSMLVACLAGFGVGLLLSRVFGHEESRYSKMSSSFDRGTAERFGRNLLERVEHALPAVLRDRLTK